MYLDSFQLRENPFATSPDPRFLFAGAAYREGVAGLVYAVIERKGFAVLTGEAGTGKTTILRVVAEALSTHQVSFAYVFNPVLTPNEFLEHTMLDFGITDVPSSKARRVLRLTEFFSEQHRQGRTCALIVDEAHKLSPEVLEEIRLLTNFETYREKLLQIVLAGQPELASLLDRPDLRQLKQRITLRLRVGPMSAGEVEQYVRHRWLHAGSAEAPPFTSGAYRKLSAYSHGIPRVVNVLCDNSLMLACAADRPSVEAVDIVQAAADLELIDSQEATSLEPRHWRVAAGNGSTPY